MLKWSQQDWGPYKEQKQQGGRCGLLAKSWKSSTWQSQYLMWSKPRSLLLIPWPLSNDCEKEALHLLSQKSLGNVESQIQPQRSSSLLSLVAVMVWKELRGIGGQNKWLGNHLHRSPPANLKRTGEISGVLREMNILIFLKQWGCAMKKEKLQKLVSLISSLN